MPGDKKLPTFPPVSFGTQWQRKSRSTALLLWDEVSWRPAVAPIMAYANILWQAINSPGIATVNLTCLVQWFTAAAKKELPRNWGEVCGPYSAMRLSLKRIGWTWQSLATFIDHKGNRHNISAIGPNMFGSLLRSVWTTRMARTASTKRGLETRNQRRVERGRGAGRHRDTHHPE